MSDLREYLASIQEGDQVYVRRGPVYWGGYARLTVRRVTKTLIRCDDSTFTRATGRVRGRAPGFGVQAHIVTPTQKVVEAYERQRLLLQLRRLLDWRVVEELPTKTLTALVAALEDGNHGNVTD